MNTVWGLSRLSRSNPGRVVLGLIAALGFAACGNGAASSSAPAAGSASANPLTVVTSTTVFADIVRNVGGPLVNVISLVPKSGDVHTFEPKPADLQTVSRANLLVMNGLGLDDWLEKTITNASASGTPLVKLGVDEPGV